MDKVIVVKHPISEEVVEGVVLNEIDGAVVLESDDVYASSDGTWKENPVSGILLLDGSWVETLWVRPR